MSPDFGIEALAVPESLHLVARGSASNPALRVGGVCIGGGGRLGPGKADWGLPLGNPPPSRDSARG